MRAPTRREVPRGNHGCEPAYEKGARQSRDDAVGDRGEKSGRNDQPVESKTKTRAEAKQDRRGVKEEAIAAKLRTARGGWQ